MVVSMGDLALSHIWCATQGRLKTPRVATISWFADKRFVLLPSLSLFLSIILLHRILRHSYGIISLYLELAHEHSIQHSILRLIRYSIRHSIRSIGRVYPYLTLHYEPSSTNCLATASLPFSLTRREHSTKTNTRRILHL
jgi:hypothetical protein